MANVMSMAEIKNRPSRNGFDLSRKNLFTAKVGECLPVACLECIPGDKHVIKTKWMTRTQPLNTAAYTRIKEYYNWYFVPTNLLWNKFNDFVMMQKDNNLKADSISDSTKLSDQHPYVTCSQIWTYVNTMATASKKNFYGYSRAELTCKLLEYLGYGDFYGALVNSTFPTYRTNAVLNIFPLLAYQKIYQDHIRYSQWENAYAPASNINYMSGAAGSNNIPLSNIDIDVENMFDLRYANWNKDYFMGILPNSQYGSVASVLVEPQELVFSRKDGTSPNANDVLNVRKPLDSDVVGRQFAIQAGTNNSPLLIDTLDRFTILALRQAEAVQKMREVMQSHEQDYKSQVEARWNVKVSAALSDRCQWLGGNSANIDINEVVNQAFGTDRQSTTGIVFERTAEIKGKGVGVGDDYQECYTECHGYLMCIYHAVPQLDFAINGIKKHNLKTLSTDYAQPELDKTGMVSMTLLELYNGEYVDGISDFTNTSLLGYAPQYYEYKTAYDEVHGAFNSTNSGLESWVAPIGSWYINSYMNAVAQMGLTKSPITYHFFKVYPFILNPIMSVNADSSVDTDQLLVNSYFDIKSVRNLDYNGLPY